MRGRRPKPKAELVLRGSRRGRKQPPDLELPTECPDPPTTLTREAKAEWDRVVPILTRKKALTKLDRAGLTIMCESWSDFVGLSAALKRETRGDERYKRLFTMRNVSFEAWLKIASRFGLTPADRPRVKVADIPDPSEAKGKARFFGVAKGA